MNKEPIITARSKKRLQKSGRFKQLGLVLFTLIVMGIIVFAAYSYFFPDEEDFTLDFYTYATVTKKDFLDALSAQGTITPAQVTELKAVVQAEVTEVYVKEGQTVESGTPIMQLTSYDLTNELIKAQAELDKALQQQQQATNNQEYELAVATFALSDSEEELVAKQATLELQQLLFEYGTISRVELDKAENEYASAQRKLLQAEHKLTVTKQTQAQNVITADQTVAEKQNNVKKINQQITALTITAPISGQVLSLKVRQFDEATANKVVAEIANLSSQYVDLEVNATQAERFRLGSDASVTVGQNSYQAQVAYIAPVAHQTQNGTFVKVRLEFTDPTDDIRPYSTANTQIHLGIYRDSLSLPRGNFLTSGQQLFVYVIREDKAIKQNVRFGMLDGNYIQILSGLEAGDQVITSSYDQFRNLNEIYIVPEGGNSRD